MASGHWPLLRFDPTMRRRGHEPVPARFAAAANLARGIPRPRGALQGGPADPSRAKRDACCSRRSSRSRSATSCTRTSPRATAAGSFRTGRTCDHGSLDHVSWACSSTHPIVASASPLTSTVDGIRALEDAGAAAVVMPSLFEEQIRAEDTAYAMYTEHGSFSQPEAGSYFPEMPDYDRGVSGHLDTLRRAVAAVDIPVIASLNAVTLGGLDRLRGAAGAGGRRGARAQHALHPGRSRDDRRATSRRTTSRPCAR